MRLPSYAPAWASAGRRPIRGASLSARLARSFARRARARRGECGCGRHETPAAPRPSACTLAIGLAARIAEGCRGRGRRSLSSAADRLRARKATRRRERSREGNRRGRRRSRDCRVLPYSWFACARRNVAPDLHTSRVNCHGACGINAVYGFRAFGAGPKRDGAGGAVRARAYPAQ